MNTDASTAAQVAAGWRVKLGVAIFVLSILLPAVGIPLSELAYVLAAGSVRARGLDRPDPGLPASPKNGELNV